jgi:hypothetical protein
VGDVKRIARIGQHGIQRLEQTEPAVGLAQQEETAVAGHVAAGEVGLDFTAIEAWKTRNLSGYSLALAKSFGLA